MPFFEHVGSGETTELKFYSECLKETVLVFPVEIDVPGVLDRNNLHYADQPPAMADALPETLQRQGAPLRPGAVAGIETGFVEKREEVRRFAAELKDDIDVPILMNVSNHRIAAIDRGLPDESLPEDIHLKIR